MFENSEELRRTALLINGIDSSKFAKFLARVIEALDQCLDSSHIFTEEERIKLKTIFDVKSVEEVETIIERVDHLLRQAIYHLVKPKVMTKELTDLGFDTDKVVVFVELWNNSASKLVDKLKDRSFDIARDRLIDTNSNVKLLSQHNSGDEQSVTPLAQIDFTLKTCHQNNKNISIDLTSKELWRLYDSVEEIQTQLDALHK